MFALFSVAFSTIFIAFGVAAVIGHVVLIDLLLRPAAVRIVQAPIADLSRPAAVRIVQAPIADLSPAR